MGRDIAEIREALGQRWFEVREAGRLDGILPSARTWKRKTSDGFVGYETKDHKLTRGAVVPEAGADGKDAKVDFLETYWSRRVEDDWGPNLHINVVSLHEEALKVRHLQIVFRAVRALRDGLLGMRLPAYDPTMSPGWRSTIYVCGAALGPAVTPELVQVESILGALWSDLQGSPVRVGRIGIDPVNGLEIGTFDSDFRWDGSHDRQAEFVRELVGDSQFLRDALQEREQRAIELSRTDHAEPVDRLRKDDEIIH